MNGGGWASPWNIEPGHREDNVPLNWKRRAISAGLSWRKMSEMTAQC